MTKDNYTPKQKAAVEKRGRDLLVHAGAGSGKTKVLVGRFYDLVDKDGISPSQILTITFTEKAAQEMKDRLRQLFLEAGQKERARQVSYAYISTIHAFCARLLRENALEARVDPAFVVLEEYEVERVQRELLREVLNEKTLRAETSFLDFLLEGPSHRLEENFLSLYEKIRGRGWKEFSFQPADCADISPGRQSYLPLVSRILNALDAKYADYKAKMGWLDFADLELKAKGLLVEHRNLQEELKEKWPHILLDELQDTNPLQLSIIELLSTPRQFFAVGDPHQSIYGFRFADLAAYQDLRRRIERGKGEVITLEDNFRSRPEILKLVDYCFAPLWPAGSAFPHISMEAKSFFPPKALPSLEAFIFAAAKQEQGRPGEVEQVCRRIHELVVREKLPIYDKEQKKSRPLDFGDCAVLLRKVRNIKDWEEGLRRYGIPFQVVRSRGFFNTPEVADLLNFLKVLENPLDNEALAAFLYSPLVGVSEDTLLVLSLQSKAAGHKSLFKALQNKIILPHPLEEEKLVFARELIGRLRVLRSHGFYRLLKEGFYQTYYPAKSYLYYQEGKQIRANLHKLLQVAHQMTTVGMDHLRDLLEAADFLRSQKDVMAEGETAAFGKGCLTLSTIHGAKGLEYPLVAVVELDSQKPSEKEPFVLGSHRELTIRIKDFFTGEKISLGSAGEREKEKIMEEELRLLYVAFTRAQEHLLLSGVFKFNQDGNLHNSHWLSLLEKPLSAKGSPLIASLKAAGESGKEIVDLNGVPIKLYWQDLKGQENIEIPATLVTASISPPSIIEEKSPQFSPQVEEQGRELLEQVRRAESPVDGSHYLITVSEVVDFFRCPRLYQLKYLWGLRGAEWEDGTRDWAEDNDTVGEGSSRDLGVFVHNLLARPIIGAVHELPLPIPEDLKGEENRIKQMWKNFAGSEYRRMMEKAAKVERELPLVVKLKDGLLRGQVDALIFEDNDKYILLDYKTGRAVEEEKGYRLQLQLYALALGKIYGIEPQKAVLYYLPEGISQEVSLIKEDLAAAEDWAEKLFYAQKQQEFPHREEHCSYCRQQKLCEQIGK